MKSTIILGIVTAMFAVGGCHTDTGTVIRPDIMEWAKAHGKDISISPKFRSLDRQYTVTLGSRNLIVQTYHADERWSNRTPHFIFADVPHVWGVGPVTVWEGQRLLLWCSMDSWWVLADMGGEQGISLFPMYDNYDGSGSGSLQLGFFREPQEKQNKSLFPNTRGGFVFLPSKLSDKGFVLRPVPSSDWFHFTVEVRRHKKFVVVGELRPDPGSKWVKSHMYPEAKHYYNGPADVSDGDNVHETMEITE